MKLSRGSRPAMTVRMVAASVTERAIGPTVSWWTDIGTTSRRYISKKLIMLSVPSPPALDVRPTVGLMPTKLFLLLGETIEPSVSLPSAAAVKPMDVPIPLPELDPEGSPNGRYAEVA